MQNVYDILDLKDAFINLLPVQMLNVRRTLNHTLMYCIDLSIYTYIALSSVHWRVLFLEEAT